MMLEEVILLTVSFGHMFHHLEYHVEKKTDADQTDM